MNSAHTQPYVPQLDVVYPSDLDGHTDKLNITHEVIIDKDYPFLDKSFRFKFMRGLMYFAIFTVVSVMNVLLYGLRVEGRQVLRRYRKLLKNGAMTVSNHVHRWDYLFVLRAVRYHAMYFPAWKENFNTPDEYWIRYAGGIPIPDDIHTIRYFNEAFDALHRMKKWIHCYPEKSMFYYFQPIRPFKKGAFTMAYRYNLPVIPLAISYRKPRFPFTVVNSVRALMGKQKLPMITLRVGEPLLFDTSLGRREAVQKLRKDCHETIVSLAGIRDNPYPAEGD